MIVHVVRTVLMVAPVQITSVMVFLQLQWLQQRPIQLVRKYFIKNVMLAKYFTWAQLSFQWSWFGWNLSGQLYRRGTIMSKLVRLYSMLKRVPDYFEFMLWKLPLQQKLSKWLSPVQQYFMLLWRRDRPRCKTLFRSIGGSADWLPRKLFDWWSGKDYFLFYLILIKSKFKNPIKRGVNWVVKDNSILA